VICERTKSVGPGATETGRYDATVSVTCEWRA